MARVAWRHPSEQGISRRQVTITGSCRRVLSKHLLSDRGRRSIDNLPAGPRRAHVGTSYDPELASPLKRRPPTSRLTLVHKAYSACVQCAPCALSVRVPCIIARCIPMPPITGARGHHRGPPELLELVAIHQTSHAALQDGRPVLLRTQRPQERCHDNMQESEGLPRLIATNCRNVACTHKP